MQSQQIMSESNVSSASGRYPIHMWTMWCLRLATREVRVIGAEGASTDHTKEALRLRCAGEISELIGMRAETSTRVVVSDASMAHLNPWQRCLLSVSASIWVAIEELHIQKCTILEISNVVGNMVSGLHELCLFKFLNSNPVMARPGFD